MSIRVLKFVLFSIIICSFRCNKNELYFISERNICLERNVINFKNNRILADADKQFNLNDFYQSTLSLSNQFNDGDDNDEEIIKLRNVIDSHLKKPNESNTLPNLNSVDEETKKSIHELQKELEEVKKELDSVRNGGLEIQPTKNKRITIKCENNSVSEHEKFNELEHYGTIWKDKYDHFEDKYNEITSSNSYKKLKVNDKLKRAVRKYLMESLAYIISWFTFPGTELGCLTLLHIPYIISIFMKLCKVIRLEIKKKKYL
ncbi:fam-b protein [Plasmodium chabaudi chabaudi]|uniref:Fam-b protein n=1 Tax=Plasmodium chabaudi chabaudi TaxID=31271 RepID=A0A4V0K068_PLACU|nr:fam-b protein [Plasmodium chabaudi chabaudi]VTZ66345.1 fam-b protein [Plasmodium chabaudi chabaudi]|eukprot:XP_016655473.1 fam-b protein [Plasmodium chabaudi chabaudi]